MAQQKTPLYKSEVFIPITKDTQTFEQRQKTIFEDMQERMERRRQQWSDQMERMRRDFFQLKPVAETRRGSSENLLESRRLNDLFYDDGGASAGVGGRKFCVSFDISQFDPHEIDVRTEEQRLLVNARHVEGAEGNVMSREFSRQVDIPRHVDPQTLQCTLSNDGILQVEAPVSAPAYDQIQQERRRQEVLNAPPPLKSAPPARQRDDGGATTTTTKTFRIAVDIGDVQPQDVVVKTIDRRLIVTARHETKSPGRTSFSEFNREFDLPDNVDPNLVTASMTDDGKLLVEAPISTTAAAAVYGEGGEGAYTPPEGAIRQPRVTIEISK